MLENMNLSEEKKEPLRLLPIRNKHFSSNQRFHLIGGAFSLVETFSSETTHKIP
jgi:hypothetical protein